MNADLDALATALYVTVDDMLITNPDLVPERPAIGITPLLSDAELATLSVIQALLGYTSEARFIRHAQVALRHLALTAAIWHNENTNQPVLRSLTAYDH